MKKSALMRLSIYMCAIITSIAWHVSTFAAEELISISSVTFATTPKWYVIQKAAIEDKILIFRKYSLPVIDGKIAGIEKLKNIFDFGCQRNRRNADYLIFHLARWAKTGLEGEEWIPQLRLNFAMNNLHSTFDAGGEYKNSSLFVDFDANVGEKLARMIVADDFIVYYGVPGKTIKMVQWERSPNGANWEGFIDELVKEIVVPSMKLGSAKSFSTQGMFDACLAYKRSGAVP